MRPSCLEFPRRWPRHLALVAAFATVFIGHNARAFAQVAPGIEQRVLQTDDNWQIYITYYSVGAEKPNAGKDVPVVVLLPGDKENRLIWEGAKGLAPLLQSKGYAVITVDPRRYSGQSTNGGRRLASDSPAGGKGTSFNPSASDFQAMVDSDLEAVKRFIYEQHQLKRLNMNKLAIIAPESSAAVALHFTANDWNKEPHDDGPTEESRTPRGHDVRALVLISPTQRVKGLSLTDVLPEVRDPDRDIAFLLLYGKYNKADARDAQAVYHKLIPKGNDERIRRKDYPYNLRGTDLLGKKEVGAENMILEFLQKHLMELRSDWRDRQSRLTAK